jgi:uncharacterized membrane protein YfhO
MDSLLPQKPKNRYWQVFGLCFVISAALFLPHCIVDGISGEFFHYAGDFNDQMIPFYSYANDFVKHGGTFSWATDLGSGFVNAFSYYSLGSPFFWLMCLFPAKWSPWLMVPMLCLKFAVAGGGAYLWLRRWPKNSDMAVLGACLYAFSGFAIYNIFFFFFVDVVALFPYLLAALDAAVLDGQHGVFPLMVAVNLLDNYFFFAGQAVFLILYFACLCVGKIYRLRGRLFGRLAFETVLGCAFGCVLLIPAGLSLLQNPRTVDPLNGYGYLVYSKSQQYPAIFYSLFLMPDAPYFNDITHDAIFKWTSLTAYLPVVGIAGGLAFCRLKKRHPFARVLKICLLCAFVPVLNSAFYCLNSSYYARWYYMPVLILCAATVLALEDWRADFRHSVKVMAILTASSALFALVPVKDGDSYKLGVVDNQARFWAIWLVTMAGIGLFALVLKFYRRSSRLGVVLLAAVLSFSFVYGTLHLSIGKYGQWEHDSEYVEQTYYEADELKAALPDNSFYRIDVYDGYNNLGIWLDKSCIQYFGSTAAPHILEFYPTVGVTRDVNSKPKTSLYALRGLLSVRYLLVPTDKVGDWQAENHNGWTRGDTVGSYVIYENSNFVPMGTGYTYYISQKDYNEIPEEERGNILMKALVLSEDQIAQYGSLLSPLPAEELEKKVYADYAQDCAERRTHAAQEFTATSTGFTAKVTQDQAGMLFFSVPYDDGFSATVNGQPVQIENVDYGMMAIRVPEGTSNIIFRYQTPGLKLSTGISAAGAVVYAGYLCLIWGSRGKRRKETVKSNDGLRKTDC